MELLLVEQTLLIALDDEHGRDTTAWASEAGLAAALLLDLGRLGLIRTEGESSLVATDAAPPEHALLHEAHELVRASAKPRSAREWVDEFQIRLKPLQQRLARGLVERGLLTEQRSKLLGFIPQTRFPAVDGEPERQLRERLLDVLLHGRQPTEAEALLIGLLLPLGLVDQVVPKQDRGTAKARAEQVSQEGLAGDAVREAVKQVQAAVIMTAVIVPTVVTIIT